LVNANAASISGFQPQTVFGIDFSGAAMAGENAWIAEMEVTPPPRKNGFRENSPRKKPLPLKLINLRPLGKAAGGSERATVYSYLTERILASRSALWGMDFPFGLPIELGLGDWPQQLRHVQDYSSDAKSYGRDLVGIARSIGDSLHIRRETDRETKTPFDCYHYRIIYQTFHGMRDVLSVIAGDEDTFVLPFDYPRFQRRSQRVFQNDTQNSAENSASTTRIVVEACPSSTLKRLSLPHQKYKQSGGKPPSDVQRANRRLMMTEISKTVEISPHRRRIMMTNPGADALDAVIAGLGSWSAWHRDDHDILAAHPRYRFEGRVYC